MKRFTMKNAIITSVLALIVVSCSTSRMSRATDDVYANPAEEKRLAIQAAEAKAKQEAEERMRQDEAAKLRQKEENKESYRDTEYDPDDYYDYEYASRINRFHRPLNGAGYYDPYYTNLYTYNQNPAFYGTSIYSSYFYGMPGPYSYSGIGLSYGWGNPSPWNNCYYSNGFYDPWCNGYYGGWNNPYNYGWNNMYNGFYSPWYNGYSAGYYNGYNNALWGYYNIYDPNSGYKDVHYGRRGSNTGGNTQGRSAGSQMYDNQVRRGYFESATEKQQQAPRFNNTVPGNNRNVIKPETVNPAATNNNRRQQQAPVENNNNQERQNNRVRSSENRGTAPEQRTAPNNQSNDTWKGRSSGSNQGGTNQRSGNSGGGVRRPR